MLNFTVVSIPKHYVLGYSRYSSGDLVCDNEYYSDTVRTRLTTKLEFARCYKSYSGAVRAAKSRLLQGYLKDFDFDGFVVIPCD